jgi:hypothetical protein
MMTTLALPRGRIALAATTTVLALGLLASPVQARAPRSAAATGTDIDLRGGDASASLVCGNVADAQDYANTHGLVIQRNNCHPKATGGSIELANVTIVIHADDVHASQDNESLSELAVSGGEATAETTCVNSGAKRVRTRRDDDDGDSVRNRCWSRAKGGRLELEDVTLINHKAGKETRKQVRAMFMRGTEGDVKTTCGWQTPSGQDARDQCGAQGVGGSMDLRNVDVTAADGTVSNNVRVSVRGGNAFASVFCFNYVRPGTNARQSNVCSSTSRGGTATLRNVTIHVFG